MLAAEGAGGGLGAIAAGRVSHRLGPARAIWLVPLLTGPALLLLPLAEPGRRIGPAVLGLVVFGFGVIIYNVAKVSYRQAICPQRLLGG